MIAHRLRSKGARFEALYWEKGRGCLQPPAPPRPSGFVRQASPQLQVLDPVSHVVVQQSLSVWQVSPVSEQTQKPLSQKSVVQSLSWVHESLTWS